MYISYTRQYIKHVEVHNVTTIQIHKALQPYTNT